MKSKDGLDVGPEQDVPFGRRLQRLRETAGLTQEELAEKADLSAKGISDLERGQRRRPYPNTVRSLADALKLSDDERAALVAVVPKRGSPRGTSARIAAPGHVLPASSTPIVGRERNLEEVRGLIRRPGVRLLTLTGTGGVGKTRLALEAVREMVGLFPDGTTFVALASLGNTDLVVPTVVRSLGLRETESRAPREILRAYLREKRLLLVLDNFEHVLEAAVEVSGLIEACTNLSVLITSRAPLRVRGEYEYPVPPLTLPASTRPCGIDEVSNSASGRLFVERARAASPAFKLTEENAGAVASICLRLDGLPLALELAAAQTRFLEPAALLSRLDRALQARGARDLPERQRTVEATVDWSHKLLHKPERNLFRSLSVFAGGFTLEAAEVVGAVGTVGVADVLMLLGNLVEQSLVVAKPSPEGRTRYRMLEPIRQYALERLEVSGEAGEVRRRHAEFFLALAERAQPEIKGHDQVEWLDRLESDNDNLNAAIGWSLAAGDAPTAARFGWALGMYWVMRARHREGRLWLEQVLSISDLPTKMRGRVHWALVVCMYGSGDDRRLEAIATEGVALSRRASDRLGEAYTLGVQGIAVLMLGEFDRAARILEESLEIFRELGDEWASAHILTHMAAVSLRRDDYPQAVGYAEEALALSRRTGDRFAANISLNLLAQAAWASGEHQRAECYLREALTIAHEMGDRMDAAYCVQGLAAAVGERDEQQRAARMLGAADALLETVGSLSRAMAMDSHQLHQRSVSAAREQLGEGAWSAAWEEGRAMTFDDAVAFALEEPLPSTP